MRILVTGASGFIGQPLVSLFQSIGTVLTLSRSNSSIIWDPKKGKANLKDFEGFDAVIHLAGEPLSPVFWTKAKKEKILISRERDTLFLSRLLTDCVQAPKVFVSASAIGFYGNRGDELLTEESSAGSGFLANVCTAWEKASSSLKSKGIRTVQTRFGVVLGPNGGILKKLAPLYKLGLGGTLGTGKQWVSWIHREDLIRAIAFIIKNEPLEGPVNLVSPNPIQQEDFAKTIAEILHRPHFLRIPVWALHLFLGNTADELLLTSQKVKCSKLLAANFSFLYADLRSALYDALQV